MRITRRLLEPKWTESSIAGRSPVRNEKARRRPSRIDSRASAALVLVAGLSTLAAMTASCSSSDGDGRPVNGGGDAAVDAASDSAAAEDVVDAGLGDAALVDATPLPIECEAPPCAVALSTTPGSDDFSRAEGYCALLTDGTVACWGANSAGQLGAPEITTTDSPVPVRVPGLPPITALDRTCAVDSDGAVWCWGHGPFLQSDASATTVETRPVRLPLPGPASKIAVAQDVGCAVLRDNRVVCWGRNFRLQIGEDLPLNEYNALPRPIPLAAGAKDIAVGVANFTIYDDGKLLSWGGSPGVGRSTPLGRDGWPTLVALDHVTMVATAGVEACAVANGVGWCWGGSDAPSVFHDSDEYARALPSAVDTPEPITRIATSQSWTVSENHTSYFEKRRWCATSVSGEVYCWGLNNAGQAGDGTKEHALSAVRVKGLPAPAAEVKVMPYSTCAILTNGRVYCWGNNANGQLGAGLPKGSVVVPQEVKLP